MELATGAIAAKSLGGTSTDLNTTVVWILYRDTAKEGFLSERYAATTCKDLVDYVKSKVSPSWVTRFKVDPGLLIFGQVHGGALMAKDLDDHVEKKMIYSVYEFWDGLLPCEVYRRCSPDQISTCVFTQPSQRSPFTMISPLGLATFKSTETQMPYFFANDQGEVNFHGLSVCLFNNAAEVEDAEVKDPLRDIGSPNEESAGLTFMTPLQFDKLVEEKDRDATFGILKTSLTHVNNGRGIRKKKGIANKKKPKSKSNQPEGQVWKREVNWVWALSALQNIRELGFLLVLDNRGEFGHGTLVRTKENHTDCDWVAAYDHLRKGPYVPPAAAKLLQETKTDLDLVLEDEGFKCIPDKEPEIMYVAAFSDDEDVACPKLAQRFKLHSMTMRASAEPQPPSTFQNNRQNQTYQAIVELFHQTNDSEMLRVIEFVEENEYDLGKLSNAQRDLLQDAFNQALFSLQDCSEDTEEEFNLLSIGDSILHDVKRHRGNSTIF
ncbi:MAG: hypothetical protein SGILL_001061 [Bacillariaceae sp.]